MKAADARAARVGVSGSNASVARRSAGVVAGAAVGLAGDDTRDETADVRVHDGMPLPVSERRDRVRGVRADARQRREQRHVIGDDPVVALDDHARARVESKRPSRVAEPTPGPDRLGRLVRGQCAPASASAPAMPHRPAARD